MKISNKDYEKLKELEESLWKAETRFDQNEFGRSGRVYSKDEVLKTPPEEIKVKLPLKNFKVDFLASNVALVTYISEVRYEEVEIANRSSIWIKTATGWQLKFHQGTPVTNNA